MNNNKLIELAKEAGFEISKYGLIIAPINNILITGDHAVESELNRFAELILAQQSEDKLNMVIQEGFKLVPIEPTKDMLEAAGKAWPRYGHLDDIIKNIKEEYKAMLSASPTPPINNELLNAAKAIVERWYLPLWGDVSHTAEYIFRLRDAIEGKPINDDEKTIKGRI